MPGLQSYLQGLWLQIAVPRLQIDEYQSHEAISLEAILVLEGDLGENV